MDELTAPRRSTHPSHHPATRQVREENEISLAEYFVAMAIDVPRLELYTRVARDLEAWMAQSRSVYAQAEEEAAKMTPELFIEFCRADEEGQTELLVRSKCTQ
jgi:kinetochore protein Spc7/SPC105